MTTPAFPDPYLTGRDAAEAQQAADRILAGPHLAILSTINADGSPQTSVILVKADADAIRFSTLRGRRKTANMQRDPRVNLLVHTMPLTAADSTYASIAGTVAITEDPTGAFHQVMYDLYMGGATPPPEPGAERLIVRLTPTRFYVPPRHSDS